MAEKESSFGILDGRFTYKALDEIENNYRLFDILNANLGESKYEKLQRDLIGDKSDLFDERYGNFKDDDMTSVLDAVSKFDSTKRVNNEDYSRGQSNYKSNIKDELNNRRKSAFYMKHKFLMGSNTSDISTLSDDEYEEYCIRKASNGECDNVMEFCKRIENDFLENRKKDNEVYSYSIHKKDGNVLSNIEYENILLTPLEKLEIAEGCHISKKHMKDPYYQKLVSDIKRISEKEFNEVRHINYSPVKLRCGYLP